MAKNRTSAFDFGEDMFSGNGNVSDNKDSKDSKDNIVNTDNKNSKVNKDKKAVKERVSGVSRNKGDVSEVTKIEKIAKKEKDAELTDIVKADVPPKTGEEKKVTKIEEIAEIENAGSENGPVKVLGTQIRDEDKVWLKLQSRKKGVQLKKYLEFLILNAPACDDPEYVMMNFKGKKISFSASISQTAFDAFYEKAKEAALSNVEYLWYIVDWARRCETQTGTPE